MTQRAACIMPPCNDYIGPQLALSQGNAGILAAPQPGKAIPRLSGEEPERLC